MNFTELLNKKFLEWQILQGGRRTAKEFAEYLGVSPSALSMWFNGKRTPEEIQLKLLSEKFGLEVYDALGLPRPDEDLHYIQTVWNELDKKSRHAIRQQTETYRTKNEPDRIHKKTTARTTDS